MEWIQDKDTDTDTYVEFLRSVVKSTDREFSSTFSRNLPVIKIVKLFKRLGLSGTFYVLNSKTEKSK